MMFRKLLTLVLLTFALGMAMSQPSPAALTCSCELTCFSNPDAPCYDENSRRWTCENYLWVHCS